MNLSDLSIIRLALAEDLERGADAKRRIDDFDAGDNLEAWKARVVADLQRLDGLFRALEARVRALEGGSPPS